MNKVKKIWNITTSVLIGIVLVLVIALVGVRLFGLQVYAVLSGSMEPKYHTGSVIYVKDVDCDELKVGDVITFMLDEDTVATHRIIEIVPDEEDPSVLRFRTKGDNNETEDGGAPVHSNNVLGTPVFTIPYLGYVSNMIQNPPGSYLAIALGAILLILLFLPDLLFSDEKEKEENAGDAESPQD